MLFRFILNCNNYDYLRKQGNLGKSIKINFPAVFWVGYSLYIYYLLFTRRKYVISPGCFVNQIARKHPACLVTILFIIMAMSNGALRARECEYVCQARTGMQLVIRGKRVCCKRRSPGDVEIHKTRTGSRKIPLF